MPESLEQLDLLLMHEVRARKIRRDGIHFQGLRYLSLTSAAYVGEDATIRFDPRDMGEIRVFYKDCFLCRAISAELAGETRVRSNPTANTTRGYLSTLMRAAPPNRFFRPVTSLVATASDSDK